MRLRDLPKALLKALVSGYSYLISPLLGQNCRFYPSCSRYAIEAIDSHGAFKGSVLALQRILKCHPWHKGDMRDPVPQHIDWAAIIGYKRAKPAHPEDCGCSGHHKTKE